VHAFLLGHGWRSCCTNRMHCPHATCAVLEAVVALTSPACTTLRVGTHTTSAPDMLQLWDALASLQPGVCSAATKYCKWVCFGQRCTETGVAAGEACMTGLWPWMPPT
jgi:hypothetical protein